MYGSSSIDSFTGNSYANSAIVVQPQIEEIVADQSAKCKMPQNRQVVQSEDMTQEQLDGPEKLEAHYCKKCGQEIIPKQGWTMDRMLKFSQQWFRSELCSECMRVEMSNPEDASKSKKSNLKQSSEQQKNENDHVCSDCGKEISQKCADYSKAHYGRPLCFNCGQKEKDGKRSE